MRVRALLQATANPKKRWTVQTGRLEIREAPSYGGSSHREICGTWDENGGPGTGIDERSERSRYRELKAQGAGPFDSDPLAHRCILAG